MHFFRRGRADQYINDAERSLKNTIMIVRRVFNAYSVIIGSSALKWTLSDIKESIFLI